MIANIPIYRKSYLLKVGYNLEMPHFGKPSAYIQEAASAEEDARRRGIVYLKKGVRRLVMISFRA